MKVEFWEAKSWESQRLFVGSPIVFFFCINIEDLEEQGAFSQLDKKRDIVRRTNFFCNKESLFSCWRKSGGTLKCYAVDRGKMNYFVFPALRPLTVRLF